MCLTLSPVLLGHPVASERGYAILIEPSSHRSFHHMSCADLSKIITPQRTSHPMMCTRYSGEAHSTILIIFSNGCQQGFVDSSMHSHCIALQNSQATWHRCEERDRFKKSSLA